MKPSIACVVVTFNRLELLKRALSCYEQQSKAPDYLIIVDNNSTDGTFDYLDEWKKQEHPFQCSIIHLPQNIGGSGGFYTGCQKLWN